VTGFVCSRGRGAKSHRIDNARDLCPYCASKGDREPSPRAEHDRFVAEHARLSRPSQSRSPSRSPSPSISEVSPPEASAELCPRPGDTLYLLDLDGLVHRLYHGVPLELSRTEAPVPINVVIGLTRQLRKLRQRASPKPRWALGVFDAAPDGGWRAREFAPYKADRPPQDPELKSQWVLVEQLLDALGLPWVRSEGVEADDLIAAYTEAAVAAGLEVVIVSDDKDLLQLVRGGGGPGSVRALSAFGELELRGPEYVRKKFGVGPERLGDALALAGDKSDGITGCPGVGTKTAAQLLGALQENEGIEHLLANWSLVPQRKISDALRDNADEIRLGRRLIELRRVDLPLALDGIRPWGRGRSALDAFFREIGFPRFEAAIDRYNEQ